MNKKTLLLEEAIGVLKAATSAQASSIKEDTGALFSHNMAAELREVTDMSIKRQVKFNIQKVMLDTHTFSQLYQPPCDAYYREN